MNNRLEKEASKAYKTILGMIGIVCMLFWWIPLLFGIGGLFRGELMQAFISFLIAIVMVVFWKGGENVIGDDKE